MDFEDDEPPKRRNCDRLIAQFYIADGFSTDCRNFVSEFVKADTIRFEIFCKMWAEHQLFEIFKYRLSIHEFAELTEECIKITKHIMTAEESTFEERVCGLYLLYAIYYMQPIKRFAKIPITAADAKQIVKIRTISQQKKHYDVLYILARLLCGGIMQFRLTTEEYGLEGAFRKSFVEKTSMNQIPTRRGTIMKNSEEFGLLRELSVLSRQYTRRKADIHDQSQPDKSLCYVNERLPNTLVASLDNLIGKGEWQTKDSGDSNWHETRSKIKNKAAAPNKPHKRQEALTLSPRKEEPRLFKARHKRTSIFNQKKAKD